jgi:hypothetical protein
MEKDRDHEEDGDDEEDGDNERMKIMREMESGGDGDS